MAYRDVVLADSPVAYWRLAETSGTAIKDEVSSNQSPGVVQGSLTLGTAGGPQGGTSIAFPGTATNYISVAVTTAIAAVVDVFSIEAWVSPGATGAVRGLFSTGISGGSYLRLETLNQLGALKNQTSNIGSTASGVGTGFHHCVWTKNGATNKLYVDGVDVTPAMTNATIIASTTAKTATLGADATDPGTAEFFNGSLQDVAFYGTALSAAQVLSHYLAAASPQPALPQPLLMKLGQFRRLWLPRVPYPQPLLTPVATGATFTDSASGQITLSGSATESAVFADSRSGTITLTGSFSQSLTTADSRSGTITLSGTATQSFSHSSSGAGTITLSGTSTQAALFADSPTGTITLSGSIAQSLSASDATSGTVVLSGFATESNSGAPAGIDNTKSVDPNLSQHLLAGVR